MKFIPKESFWFVIALIFAFTTHALGDVLPLVLKKATPTPTPTQIPTPNPAYTPFPIPDFLAFPFTIPSATGSQETVNRSILHPFSGASAEENGVAIQAAGFGTYSQADVSFGYLPVDNAFDGATDGQGVIIRADPGEGVMILCARIDDTQSALIRCSVRADQPHALVTIASVGSVPDRFIATNYPDNEAYFTNQYMRLQTFCVPPSAGFQPVIQVVNSSPTETLTVYLDNFDVYFIDPNKYYSGNFLDGDESDPPADQISMSVVSAAMGMEWNLKPLLPKDFKIEIGACNTEIKGSWSWEGISYGLWDTLYVERSTTNEFKKYVTVYWSPCFMYPTECADWGLALNTTYYYRIRVVHIQGGTDYSGTVTYKTPS